MSDARSVDLSYEDGVRAVHLAREAVESYVTNGQRVQPGSMRDAFYARTGAFVRLESTRGRGSLRGCAGRHRTDERLGDELVDAAIRAASGDSCGSEVSQPELSSLLVSVCAVTDVAGTEDPVADVEIGTHGVVVDGGGSSGWLYPTVPVENGWGTEEYLARTCRSAGLSPTDWRDEDVAVRLFEGTLFREREPEGSVEAL